MPKIGAPEQDNPFKKIELKEPKKKVTQDLAALEQANQKGDITYKDRKDHNQLKKDDFLKLLTHQLAHQDPLKPMDQKEFSADLAQFAQLEQMTAMNKHIEKMAISEEASRRLQGLEFLGKRISTNGNTLNVSKKMKALELNFALPEKATKGVARIFDTAGQMVGEIPFDAKNKGRHVLSWDLMGLDKRIVAEGKYSFEVIAWDETEKPFSGKTSMDGIVTKTIFEDGIPLLEINGEKKIRIEEIESFALPEAEVKTAIKEATKAFKNNQKTEKMLH